MGLDLTNWADTKRYAVDGYTPVPTIETIWGVLKNYNVQPLDKYRGMDITDIRDIHEPMIEGCSWTFKTDNIEKVNVTYLVFMKRMAVTFSMIFPDDDHDFPVFSSELVENPNNIHLLLDLHPLQDIVLFTDYRRRYLDGVGAIWQEYLDVQNDINPHIWYRSMLGPYSLTGRHKPDANRTMASRALEVIRKYLEYYMDEVVVKASPVTDTWQKDFANRKKQKMKEIYIMGDPGSGPLMKVLGKERGHKIMECVL
ncbi:MAG: phytochromobilin:ferredoxin oxidoreductase [Dehalococcoidia bacterium]|nr:phytochromobilin:ferredoxin oxidoreductase [Dehalococcoidia bacterium]